MKTERPEYIQTRCHSKNHKIWPTYEIERKWCPKRGNMKVKWSGGFYCETCDKTYNDCRNKRGSQRRIALKGYTVE